MLYKHPTKKTLFNIIKKKNHIIKNNNIKNFSEK